MLNQLYNLFWSERLWLGTKARWADLSEHTNAHNLLWTLPILGAIFVLRVFVQKYLLAFGKYLGVKEKKLRNVPDNKKLEEIYRNCRSRQFKVYAVAKQLDMSEREVERWWRLRRCHDKPSNLIKFTEYMFKTCFYFCTSVVGLYLIWDKQWAWNMTLIWKDYPHHSIETNLKWYYILELSFYLYVILDLLYDTRRKDTLLMLTHHILAIFMCFTCWIVNFYRIAIVSLVLQDQADCLLHFVKAMRSANLKLWYWIAFVAFFINWFITRLYIYPKYILQSGFNKLWDTDIYLLGVTFCTILTLIYLLQLYWTWLIIRVVYNFIITKEARDIRSSTSESSENSENLEGKS